MGSVGDFGYPGLVSSWGLTRFCGPYPVNGVRAKEVLRVEQEKVTSTSFSGDFIQAKPSLFFGKY